MIFKFKKSIGSLVLANLIPLLGVLFAGWNVFFILLLYWVENVVVGIINVFKMKKTMGVLSEDGPVNVRNISKYIRKGLLSFFGLHYGLFTLVHGVFVFAFFFDDLDLLGFLISVLFLSLSHLFSYYVNFLGEREFTKITPAAQMFAPYKRVIVLHLTVLLGGILTMSLEDPFYGIVVLVVIKILGDLFFHYREHFKFKKFNA